ncbi:hypothetical protein HanOQP8_Chr13g0472651 [Helianthus annuus]|nr:hypothetical protein HanOQP8_Chr13g0472651 [Helianthus annuus]
MLDTLTAGYITLFWDFFSACNFRLPMTKFFLEIISYYKFHISQMHPIGMVRVRHFEFACREMHIEPTVDRFRVFHQMHCSQGFYSFIQRASAKKILGKEKVATETIQTPYSEAWYQDIKDVPSIALPEKALVGAAISLCWRMNREDKPVYMEGDSSKILRRWEDGHYAKKGLTRSFGIIRLSRILFFREMKICPRNL